MINGRLLLLFAATGLFAHVWSANDRALDRNRARNATSVMTVTQQIPVLEEAWTANSCPVPLPGEIEGGAYRVIDDTGRVARLEIAPACTSAAIAGTPPSSPEIYVITVGPRRWYFVRLQTPGCQRELATAPAITKETSKENPAVESCRPPCLNRKFDFTGYASTTSVDNELGGFVPLSEPADLSGL